jgi:predicted Zn-dependent protease
MRPKVTSPLVTLPAILLLLTAPAVAQKENAGIESIGNRDINKNPHLKTMDLESEMAMGRQASRELEQKVTLVQDPAVTQYIDRVGQNIVRNSDAKVPFTIRVIDSDDIGAIGLLGGFLYVNKGLILAADDEAELASVMAHEIAHVAARHAVEVQSKASLLRITSMPSHNGAQGMIIQQAANIGVPLSALAFAREMEKEADWLGLQYLYEAGYDPQSMVTFFEKLQAREPAKKRSSGLLATQPPTADRIRQTQQNIARYLPVRAQAFITSGDFLAVKARLLAGLKSKTDASFVIDPRPSLLPVTGDTKP